MPHHANISFTVHVGTPLVHAVLCSCAVDSPSSGIRRMATTLPHDGVNEPDNHLTIRPAWSVASSRRSAQPGGVVREPCRHTLHHSLDLSFGGPSRHPARRIRSMPTNLSSTTEDFEKIDHCTVVCHLRVLHALVGEPTSRREASYPISGDAPPDAEGPYGADTVPVVHRETTRTPQVQGVDVRPRRPAPRVQQQRPYHGRWRSRLGQDVVRPHCGTPHIVRRLPYGANQGGLLSRSRSCHIRGAD